VSGGDGATLVCLLLQRRSPTPTRTFVRVAALVLVGSFLPDLGLLLWEPAVTVRVVVLVNVHVLAAVIALGILTRGLDDVIERSMLAGVHQCNTQKR
jgi:low temperature requirement protein LtrA